MQITTSNIIKLSFASVCIIMGFTLTNCCSSDYVWVKVQRSALIPDTYELNRDSLIVGGMRICKIAQRYYHKPISIGGGGGVFTGFAIPPHIVKTEYGQYAIMVKTGKAIVTGTGMLKGFDEFTPMKVAFTVFPEAISSAILN